MVKHIMFILQVKPDDFPAQDNLFQTAFWGMFKAGCGQQAAFFLCKTEKEQFPILILIRKAINGDFYAYAPKAPSIFICEENRGQFLEELAESLKPFLPTNTVCIRFDTLWKSPFGYNNEDVPRPEIFEMRMNWGTENHNLRKSVKDHFCPNTVIIDLRSTPEQLLTHMRQTTRNSIRKSYRHGVVFSEKDISFLPTWHALYKDTGNRKGFFTEDLDYFKKLLGNEHLLGRIFFKQVASPHEDSGKGPPLAMPMTAPAPRPSFHILVAEKDDKLLSGMILAFCEKTAYYLYSGSDPLLNKLMAGYGLQWEAMLAARKAGCIYYDLLGIPPNNDKSHPMNGLYTFKTGFGGYPVSFLGCWDYPYDKERYSSLRNAEML